jgi:hypothetical protein
MRILRRVDDQFWFDVARKCEYATFFHTPLWNRLAAQTYPEYRDATIGAELESGVRLVLPLLEGRSVKGLFRTLVSTLAGCYGGLIADGPVTLAERQQVYQAVVGQCCLGSLKITGNPLAAESEVFGHFDVREDFTQLLQLDAGYDVIFANFSRTCRQQISKGRRRGVRTHLAKTLSDCQAYYGAYADSLGRWGDNVTSRYPWLLFENGYHLAQEFPEHLKLWLAGEGKVITGAWVFYWNKHAVDWHMASYAQFFGYAPNNVLVADMIKDACEQGYRYFDFNPSGGHEGVARFKRSFGAERRTIRRYSFSKKSFQVIQGIARKVRSSKRGNLQNLYQSPSMMAKMISTEQV